MSLAGFQINPIGVIFYLQKSLEIFDKNSATKVRSNKLEKVFELYALVGILGISKLFL